MAHHTPQFLDGPTAHQFHEMRWGCGSGRAVPVVERDDETTVINGIWYCLCSRAIHQDCLSGHNPATRGCRHDDCPVFPPDRLAS